MYITINPSREHDKGVKKMEYYILHRLSSQGEADNFFDETIIYPNVDEYKESFWKHDYKITYTVHGIIFIVNANCAQEAIDCMIDYIEDKGPEGYLLSDDEIIELENDGYLDDYISGGNHGRYLSSYHIIIEKL